MKYISQRLIALLITMSLLFGSIPTVFAGSGIEYDEDGGVWDFDNGTYTAPDGTIVYIFDGNSNSGDNSGYVGTNQNPDGSVNNYTGDPTETTPPSSETTILGYVTTNVDKANLRSSIGGPVICQLDKGLTFPYTKEPEQDSGFTWYYIEADEKSGYLRNDVVIVSSATSESPPPDNSQPDPDDWPLNAPEASYTTLKIGATGDAVLNLTTELKNQGYFNGSPTANYTESVVAAVRSFQTAKGMTADGIAGPATQHRLYGTVPVGAGDNSNLTMTIYPAETIDWYTGGINELWQRGDNYKVYDVKTGIVWWAHRWGGGYHVDAEPLTAKDTARLCRSYGVYSAQEIADRNLWQRRPILVTIDTHTYACSLYGVPHNYPEGDTIEDNDFNGQLCIHFTNSRTHAGNAVDQYHKEAIDYALRNAPNGHKYNLPDDTDPNQENENPNQNQETGNNDPIQNPEPNNEEIPTVTAIELTLDQLSKITFDAQESTEKIFVFTPEGSGYYEFSVSANFAASFSFLDDQQQSYNSRTYCTRGRKYYIYVRINGTNSNAYIEAKVQTAHGLISASAKGNKFSFNVPQHDSAILETEVLCIDGELTYQWYDNTWTPISGATNPAYQVDDVNSNLAFSCLVSDSYGHNASVYYNVYVDNNLTLALEGSWERVLPYGGSDTLSVKASCNSGAITYKWYIDGTEVENSNQPSFNTGMVKKCTSISCSASDIYGNEQYVYFSIKIENGFTAKSIGDTQRKVPLGSEVRLAVDANCTTGDLSYQWYIYSHHGYQLITGKYTSTCTTEPVYGETKYYCQISDKYGNTKYIYFNIVIDNAFTAVATSEQTIYVELGSTHQLGIAANCNMGSITFEWTQNIYDPSTEQYISNKLTGINQPEITTVPIMNKQYYSCYIKDLYGNNTVINFYIIIDNDLTASAEQSWISVNPFQTTTLSVQSSCRQGELSYKWFKKTENSSFLVIEGEHQQIYETSPISGPTDYYCEVTDFYGNQKYVYFSVRVKNSIKALTNGTTKEAELGHSVTLELFATCDTGNLFYQWFSKNLDKDGNYQNTKIDGAKESLYTTPAIQEYSEYFCRIDDQFGNSITVYFYIHVYNAFSIKPVGSAYKIVQYGDTVLLEVTSEYLSGSCTYQWYSYDDNWRQEKIQNATSQSYQTTPIQKSQRFKCVGKDSYGNESYVEFNLVIDNELTVDPIGPTIIYVSDGDSVQLAVDAHCKNGNLNYKWDNYGKVLTNTDPAITTSEIYTHTGYSCVVTDEYGNRAAVDFEIFINTGFSIKNSRHNEVLVNPGENLDLTIEATCTDSEIHYTWNYSAYDPISGITDHVYGINGPTLSLEDIQGHIYADCCVYDNYGNEEYVIYTIDIENHFTICTVGAPVIHIAPGDSVELEVNVQADREEFSYYWGEYYGITTIRDPNQKILLLEEVNHENFIYCNVTDYYGNTQSIEYLIVIDDYNAELSMNSSNPFIANNYDCRVFSISPDISGYFTITATGVPADSWSELFDQNHGLLAVREDEYDYIHKRMNLSTYLEANTTYYFYLRVYDPCSYSITITQKDPLSLTTDIVLLNDQTVILPIPSGEIISENSSQPSITSIHLGTITANATGESKITIHTRDMAYVYNVTVYENSGSFALPESLTLIEQEAFDGLPLKFTKLGIAVNKVEKHAFRNTNLMQIIVLSENTRIEYGAFIGISPTIICKPHSFAEYFAKEYQLPYAYYAE